MEQMEMFKEFGRRVTEEDVWAAWDKQREILGRNVSSREMWENWVKNHMHKTSKIWLDEAGYICVEYV